MRILIHGINYAPEFVGIGKYSSEMAEWLAMRGHEVRFHCTRPYYPNWRVPDEYEGGAHDREILNGVDLRRHRIYVPSEPTGFRRLRHHLSWLSNSRQPIRESAKEFHPNIIVAIAPSLIGAPAALAAGRDAKAPTLLHIQDFEVGAAGASGLIRSNALLKTASWVEGALIGRFDYVTTISPAMQKRLFDIGLSSNQTSVVRNWVDTSQIKPITPAQSRLRAEFGFTEQDIVCLYSGTISRKQGLETVIEAARKLQNCHEIKFLICGEGPSKVDFLTAASGLCNVRFGPFQPTDKLSDLLGAADIHLLPQIAGAADLVLPSKLTGMLASGRPVIATSPPNSGLALEVSGAGRVIEPGSVNALMQEIVHLANDKDARLALGNAARRRAIEVWEKSEVLKRLESALISLAKQN